jgi:hypothetical protein
MDLEEVRDQIDLLFNPEPDEGGDGPPEFPHPRLEKLYKLDFTYMKCPSWESSSVHRYTRHCGAKDDALDLLTRNSDMPMRLMLSALRLLADSIITYFDNEKREGEIRFYPAILLTFWSGFETFVKHSSEMLLLTVPTIPTPVRHFLQETEQIISENGSIRTRSRFQSVLHRYSVLLFYGYDYKTDKSSGFWQNLGKAKKLRDYYTHLDMNKPRSVTTSDVMTFIEATLLGLIWPSSILQRTLLLGQYQLYAIWAELGQFAVTYRERPFFLDWHLGAESRLFHCNFEDVDASRYPSVRDKHFSNHRRPGQCDKRASREARFAGLPYNAIFQNQLLCAKIL